MLNCEYLRFKSAALSLVCLCLIIALMPNPVEAQTRRPTTRRPQPQRPAAQPEPEIKREPLPPFQVMARVYQARIDPASVGDVSGQVYRLRSSGLADEEKWLNAFAKVYPKFDLALIQSSQLRVFRSSRATRVVLGSTEGRVLELMLSGANSYGDGKTPGTALIVETNLNFGRPQAISLDIETVEVEDGMSYFYTVPGLRISTDDYITFLRPDAPRAAFGDEVYMLVFAFSVELTPPVSQTRILDESKSEEIEAAATRRIVPDVTEDLKRRQLNGAVRTRVEIAPDGRIAHAHIISSTFPEMNAAVLSAVRQWEFSPNLFADDKRPISAILRFDFTAPKQ